MAVGGKKGSGKAEKSLEPVFQTRWIARSNSKRWMDMQGTAQEARKLRPKHRGALPHVRSSVQVQAGALQPPSEKEQAPLHQGPQKVMGPWCLTLLESFQVKWEPCSSTAHVSVLPLPEVATVQSVASLLLAK